MKIYKDAIIYNYNSHNIVIRNVGMKVQFLFFAEEDEVCQSNLKYEHKKIDLFAWWRVRKILKLANKNNPSI